MARTRIVTKTLARITPEEYLKIYGLNLRGNGGMQGELSYLRRNPDRAKETHIVMLKDGPTVLSWALVFPDGKERTTYFYTRRALRGKGLGTRVMRAVKKVEPVPNVCPHTMESGRFFKKFEGSVKWDEAGQHWIDRA